MKITNNGLNEQRRQSDICPSTLESPFPCTKHCVPAFGRWNEVTLLEAGLPNTPVSVSRRRFNIIQCNERIQKLLWQLTKSVRLKGGEVHL